VLQKTISAITAASWEAISQAVLRNARQTKLEPAAMVRIDSTVTEALMHEPTDSSLLWDAVRVMTRLLKRARALGGTVAIA
jgi:IS5 family transposase